MQEPHTWWEAESPAQSARAGFSSLERGIEPRPPALSSAAPMHKATAGAPRPAFPGPLSTKTDDGSSEKWPTRGWDGASAK